MIEINITGFMVGTLIKSEVFMFKNFRDKRHKRKKELLQAYKKGYDKAETLKNEFIKSLKTKHNQVVKNKDNKLLELEKKVQRIEDSLNSLSDLICIANSVIKKLKNNSYAATMLTTDNHKKIESINDEIEMLEIRVNKSINKANEKILEFKRIVNE